MNSPPLPLEEQQQSLTKDLLAVKIPKSLGLFFLLFFFFFPRFFSPGKMRRQNNTPRHKRDKQPELLLKILIFLLHIYCFTFSNDPNS